MSAHSIIGFLIPEPPTPVRKISKKYLKEMLAFFPRVLHNYSCPVTERFS